MKKLFSILILFLFHCSYLGAQWIESTGLEGANITSIASVDSVIFAVSENIGLYKKKNNNDWEKIYPDFNNFQKIEKAGSCLIASYGNWGAQPIKSFDGGNTWETITTIWDNNFKIVDTVIFTPLSDGDLKRSFDYGISYDTISIPEIPEDYASFTCYGDKYLYVFMEDYVNTDDQLLYYSNDFGNSWLTLPTAGIPNSWIIEEIFFLDNKYWAEIKGGTFPSELIMLEETASEWISVSGDNLTSNSIIDIYEYNNKVLISTYYEPVHYFDTLTNEWVEFGEPNKIVNQFTVSGDSLLCATQQGISFLDTSGTYSNINNGLNHRTISSISSNTNKVYAFANNELFVSTDGSATFDQVPGAYGFQIIATDTVLYTLNNFDLRISRDEGETWEVYDNWPTTYDNLGLTHLSIINNYYFLGTYKG